MAKITYEEASEDGGILRDAIRAIDKAEAVAELHATERAKLYAAKTALEYALLRIAINLLEEQIGAMEEID